MPGSRKNYMARFGIVSGQTLLSLVISRLRIDAWGEFRADLRCGGCFIRDTTRAYSTPFPVNRSEIATLGTLAYSWSQISAYLRHARVIFDEKDLKAVAWAIDETIFPASRRK